MTGLIILITIAAIQVIAITYAFRYGDTDPVYSWPACLWGVVSIIALFVFMGNYNSYVKLEGQYKTIEAKVQLVDRNTSTLVEEFKTLVLKYPELESQLLRDLKAESIVWAGNIYPNLKADQSYNKVADLIVQRSVERETLEKQKYDLQGQLYGYSKWFWFAGEYRNIN